MHKFVHLSVRDVPRPVYGVNTPLPRLNSASKPALMKVLAPATQIRGTLDSPGTAEPAGRRDGCEPGHARKPMTEGALPSPDTCRAKAAGFSDYADCLVERPARCGYALSFGDGFFCLHPQRNEIAMRTSHRAEQERDRR